ncbi:hypothetical protein MKX03_002536 [Papaver bracteatum]|nr:hypothetical protein MKX03_002536 [Papaver bracteatum]
MPFFAKNSSYVMEYRRHYQRKHPGPWQWTRGVNMVSINARLLVGPEISMKASYLKGAAELYEDGMLVTVDQKFLVDSHICVIEDVSSYGRYLCFNHVVKRPDDAVEFAKMLTPSTTTTTLSAATRLVVQ